MSKAERKGKESKRHYDELGSNTLPLIKTLEEKRKNLQEEKKKIRDIIKASETPEEKRARRLKEKLDKECRRRQRMGWDNEYQQYTDQDNPFGDSSLTSTFVWKKKLERDGLKDASIKAVEIISKQKQVENRLELEKVKKRRLEREMEKQIREEETVKQQRLRETAQFEEWEKQEDLFHFEQAKLRSSLRIQDGRAKPIDLLAQYISGRNLEEGIEMQMHEPYVLLNGLSVHDLEDLLIDIKVFRELEKGNNSDFWADMTLIVEDELQKLTKLKNESKNVGRREGINHSVVREVSDIFRGKDAKQLEDLRCRIERKIESRTEGIDISYWESLLLQLKAHLAKARLRDKHHEILTSKLKLLRSIPNEKSDPPSCSYADSSLASSNEAEKIKETNRESEILLFKSFSSYEEGNYSPKYHMPDDVNDMIVRNESDDESELQQNREQYLNRLQNQDYFTKEELKLRNEARSGMTDDEAEFSVEATLSGNVQISCDKYRPRKPRYFNRVHTGFEWNKYNQTHYDMDNPPPKIVQGYKFNIFYPDLIDKSSTPQYILKTCKENSDFAILRFHAGPPYEDIAFKIVNREWEFSYKRGFRCQFHNNIFQLWFHFKRYRYRR